MIGKNLDLKRGGNKRYQKTAAYGHFGRWVPPGFACLEAGGGLNGGLRALGWVPVQRRLKGRGGLAWRLRVSGMGGARGSLTRWAVPEDRRLRCPGWACLEAAGGLDWWACLQAAGVWKGRGRGHLLVL